MRVVLAEDSLLLREGLVRLLDEAGAEVVAAVGDGDALIEAVVEQRPDVAVVDVRMPPSFTDEGLRAALEVRRRAPETAILVLSQYVEESYASDLLAAGGGVGYLLKDEHRDRPHPDDHTGGGGETHLVDLRQARVAAVGRRSPPRACRADLAGGLSVDGWL